MKHLILPILAALLLAGCSKNDTPEVANANLSAAMPAAMPTAAPSTAAMPSAGGFDPATAPLGTGSVGAFPFFGLLEGYEAAEVRNGRDRSVGSWVLENQKDAQYDRYEFFDGTKLIKVEGRLRTVEAIGTGASFFQVQKNYEKLIHDLGGVTVWEGNMQALNDRKLEFGERRHRDRFNMAAYEQAGVYMVRLADRQIWIEVFQSYDEKKDNYWLTVVETKPLTVTVQAVPAEQLKQALDSAGRVALYINFDTDNTTLRPDAQSAIAEVVKLLNANPGLRLEVQGHTDDSGTPARNQTLSAGRANAVVGALMAQGIDMGRLVPKGYGQSKPLGPNTSDEGKAKNRRVELVRL